LIADAECQRRAPNRHAVAPAVTCATTSSGLTPARRLLWSGSMSIRRLAAALLVIAALAATAGATPPPEAGDPIRADQGLATGSWPDSLQIDVPRGPRDQAPSVALVANHTATDGPLGAGWALAAGGAITRHSANGGVPNYSNDRYRIDGMDLIWVTSPGTAHYQTETWDGARIEYDTATNTWTRRKEGWIWTYGSTTGTGTGATRLLSESGDVAMPNTGWITVWCLPVLCRTAAWKLSLVEDPFGNKTLYHYTTHAVPAALAALYPWASTGETLLASITYHGGAAVITFKYDGDHPAPAFTAEDGRRALRAKRLTEIETRFNGALYSRYGIQYEDETTSTFLPTPLTDCDGNAAVADPEPGRSLVRKIFRMTGVRVGFPLRCLRSFHGPTTWDDDTTATILDVITPASTFPDATRDLAIPVALNLDGDGVDDLVVLGLTTSGGTFSANHRAYVATPNLDRRFAPSTAGGTPGQMALTWETRIRLRLSGSLFTAGRGYAFADLDADSEPEILWEDLNGDVQRDVLSGAAFITQSTGLDGCDLRHGELADIDGDRHPDLIIKAHPGGGGCLEVSETQWIHNSGVWPWLDSSTKRFLPTPLETGAAPDEWLDMIFPPPGGSTVCPNGVEWPLTGNANWTEASYIADHARYGDFNRDGLADVIYSLYGCWNEIEDTDDPLTAWIDLDYDPVVDSQFTRMFYGDGTGRFVDSQQPGGAPLLLDNDASSGSELYPDRLLGGILSAADLDHDGVPELLHTDAVGYGIVAGASAFHGLATGYQLEAMFGYMDEELDVPGMSYLAPGYECYPRTASATLGDFDGNGFVDILTIELDEEGDSEICPEGEWCAVLRDSHRTVAEGRMISSDGPWGGRTYLTWGFSAQAPHDNPELAANLEVIERVSGGAGAVELSYRGAVTYGGKPTPFAEVERLNARGELDVFGFITSPWAPGKPTHAARYRTNGQLEHATVYIHGAKQGAGYYFTSSYPYFNPLVRQCDYEVGNNPLQPRSLAGLIDDCYEFSGTGPPLTGTPIGTIDGVEYHQVDAPYLPMVVGHTHGKVIGGNVALYRAAAGGNDALIHGEIASPAAWEDYDVMSGLILATAPFLRWPTPSALAGKVPAVEAAEDAYSYPVEFGIGGSVVVGFVEDWFYDVPTKRLVSSVEHGDIATTADDRTHAYQHDQPNTNNHWYRLTEDLARTAGNAVLWKKTRADFVGWSIAKTESTCGTGASCRTDTFTYTTTGELDTHTAPDGGLERRGRGACGAVTTHTDPVLRKRSYVLDGVCRVQSTSFERGTVTLTRDSYGRVTTTVADPGDGGATTTTTTYFDDALATAEDKLYAEPRQATRRQDGQVVLTYLDGFGRTTKQVECTDAGPTTGGGVFASVSCAAGTDRVIEWNLWGTDGALKIATEPFDPGEVPVTRGAGHDGYGRPIIELTPADTEGLPAWNQTTYRRGPAYLEAIDPIGRSAKLTFTTLRRELKHAGASRWIVDRDASGRIWHLTDSAGAGTTLAYDTFGNLSTVTRDPVVNCVAALGLIGPCTSVHRYTSHDLNGRVLTEQFPDGVNATYTYDKLGRRLTTKVAGTFVETIAYRRATTTVRPAVTVTDRSGAARVSVRDGFDREVKLTVAGEDTTTTWGANGERATFVDRGGRTTSWFYDLHDDLASAAAPESGTTTFDHDGHGRPVLITDADGAIERRIYTYSGKLARQTLGDFWTTLERGYDAVGRQTSGLDAGIRWSATYDAQDRLDVASRGLGAAGGPEMTIDFAYDAGDRVTERKATAKSGSTTTARFGYDGLGRLVTVTPAITVPSAIWNYDLDIVGRVRFVRTPNQYQAETVYDHWGRVTAQQVPGGWSYTSYSHGESYDGVANLTRVDRWDAEDAAVSGATDAFFIDALGRELGAIDHEGVERQKLWDGDSLAGLTWTDPAGAVLRQVDYLTDAATGRLDSVVGPYLPGDTAIDTTSYEYTPAGRVTQQISPESVTTFGYDRGLPATEAWDDQLETTVRGDPESIAPTSITLTGTGGKVRTRTFGRDDLGRIINETVSATGRPQVKTTRTGFDVFGHPTTEIRRVGSAVEATTSWVFGELGRPTERTITTTGGDVATTRWGWLMDGNLQQTTLPSGEVIAYQYATPHDGMIDRVWDPGGGPDYAVIVARNLRGQITELEQPADGTVRTLAYDDAGRVVARTSGPSGGVPVLDWTATYDGLGRLESETIYTNAVGWTDEYAYDGRGRLAWERRGQAGEQRRYTWSTGGNLLLTELDAGAGWVPELAASYTGERLDSVVGGAAITRDAWQAITGDHHGNALTYSADGEVRTITGPGASAVTILRDADGMPIRHDEGGPQSRRIVYGLDPAAPPLEVRESDGDIATYVAGAGHTLGQLRNGVFQNAETRAGSLQRYAGEVLDPSSGFGATSEPPAGSPDERFVFAGLEQVKGAVGIHLARHRVYDADTARFTSPDPIGLAGGAHRFRYAEGDPINAVDPMGWEPCHLTLTGSTPSISQQLPTVMLDTLGLGANDESWSVFTQGSFGDDSLAGMAVDLGDLTGPGGCPPGALCDGGPGDGGGGGGGWPGGSHGPAGSLGGESFASSGAKADREQRRADRKAAREERRAARERYRDDRKEQIADWKGLKKWLRDSYIMGECSGWGPCNVPRGPKRPDKAPKPWKDSGTNGPSVETPEDDAGGGIKIGGGGSGPTPPGTTWGPITPEEDPSPFGEEKIEEVAATAPETAGEVVSSESGNPTQTEVITIQIDSTRGHREDTHELTRDPPLITDDPPAEEQDRPRPTGTTRGADENRDARSGGAEAKAWMDKQRKSQRDWERDRDVHQNDDVGWEASIEISGAAYGMTIETKAYDITDPSWDEIKRNTTIVVKTPDGKIKGTIDGIKLEPSVSLDGVKVDDHSLSFEFRGIGVTLEEGKVTFSFSGAKVVCTATGCTGDLSGLEATVGPVKIGLDPNHPYVEIGVDGKIGKMKVGVKIKKKFEGRRE
jgi:RHS repeat-associated protein